jgi:hypothetical protein
VGRAAIGFLRLRQRQLPDYLVNSRRQSLYGLKLRHQAQQKRRTLVGLGCMRRFARR